MGEAIVLSLWLWRIVTGAGRLSLPRAKRPKRAQIRSSMSDRGVGSMTGRFDGLLSNEPVKLPDASGVRSLPPRQALERHPDGRHLYVACRSRTPPFDY